jgi:MATE family multidrug resistance protein
MHVVDSIFVGRLGAAQLGALGFSGIWLWTVMSVFSGTATGVQTFVSQAHGAGDEKSCGAWAWQSLYAVVPPLTLALFAFVAGADWLWRIAGASPEIREHALAYARMRPYGMAGLGVWMVLAAFFRGLGNTRTPLLATIVANAVNALLAWALVFGRMGLPAMGVAGAGLATSIAEWVGAAILVIALSLGPVKQRYATQPVRPDGQAIRRFLRTGLPIGGQWVLDMAAFAVFTTLVARMGDASMAASQAFISLLSLSFMQASGLSVAAATLVGRYVGAGDPASAERSFRTALGLAAALGGSVALLFLTAPDLLLGLYSEDADVLALGGPLLALGAGFQLLDALGITTSGALRGAGDTRWPFLAQASLAWFVFLPAAWLCGVTFGGGLTGAWAGGLVYVACLAAAFIWRFRAGAWRGIRI